ncbi:MAG: hypothetical protein QNJ27_00350 [Simkaniaceae bacterium]|nr:hypothetical protein [Simkaniaceae bacterium]
MRSFLKIYIDRLGDGKTEKIDETLSPEIMDVHEKDLQFNRPIQLLGKAYLAEDHLIIQLKIKTEAEIPCLICNERTQKKIVISSFCHTEDVANIKGHVYNCAAFVREAILLEVPSFVECAGNCSKRAQLKNYLHKEETQFPFADLKQE